MAIPVAAALEEEAPLLHGRRRCAGGFRGRAEEGELHRRANGGVTVSQILPRVVSMMMVGHLGELALSGVAVATSLANVILWER
ncbi:hypothetical protein SASPL_146820 [Salvia splendens]|uniref:Uncharacterized protein n=1 Tax=Salvia splendens TaxID=180675 RepID=A0A8X8WEL1_SALSN|nr:hypothetical protein SASPL_146820 [Salvia splendens]